MDKNNQSHATTESAEPTSDPAAVAAANDGSRFVPPLPRREPVNTNNTARVEFSASAGSISAGSISAGSVSAGSVSAASRRPNGTFQRSRQENYVADQNLSGVRSSQGGATSSSTSEQAQRMKALQPNGRKNYENTLVMTLNTDPGATLKFEKPLTSCKSTTRQGLSRAGAGVRPISSLDMFGDGSDNFTELSCDDNFTGDVDSMGRSGRVNCAEKRSVTLPRYSSAEATPVVHDNIGRSGVKKMAKLWRFLTKKRPQSQASLRASPVMRSLDSACQTDDDFLDCLAVGNRLSMISNSSSFSSTASPSCFCAGLRLSCGGERRQDNRLTAETAVTSDMHTTTESLRVSAGNSLLVHGSEAMELLAINVGGQEAQSLAASLAAAHLGNSSSPSAPLIGTGVPPRDRGAYRHFCCGSGGSASSSVVSLSGERRDMAPGQMRPTVVGVPDPPAPTLPSEPEVAELPQPCRDPSPPPPAILPRGSGGSTIHTQIDYVHCLVPDLARIASCSYYWGVMDRYEAERLLDGKPEGTFLLRDSAQFDFLFSVSFRRYGRSLHARVEQWNHRFSFDSHDQSVFSSPSVCELIEHYKDPASCMFFEPLLTAPLPRNFTFSLQSLCRTAVCASTTYDGIVSLPLPQTLRDYLQYYHYKQEVRVRRFETLPVPPVPPTRPLPPLPQPHGTVRGGGQENHRAGEGAAADVTGAPSILGSEGS